MKRLILAIEIGVMAGGIAGCGQKSLDEAVKMEISGRNLFIAITQSNTERYAISNLANVWPHTSEEDGLSDNGNDIAGMKFTSATAYFKTLFGVGGDESYVDIDISYAMSEGKSMWCVAQGVVDEMSDNVPVLISANFDCSVLPCSWTGSESNASKPIPIGLLGKMGDSAIVVVYKGGRVKVIKKKDVTLHNILGDAQIDMMPQSWLGPDNVIIANAK